MYRMQSGISPVLPSIYPMSKGDTRLGVHWLEACQQRQGELPGTRNQTASLMNHRAYPIRAKEGRSRTRH